MGLLKSYVFIVIFCLNCTLGENKDFGDFLTNIPHQVQSAWSRMIEAIKRPVRIRRYKSSQEPTIFKTGAMELTTDTTLLMPASEDRILTFSILPLIVPIERTTTNPRMKVTIPTLGTRNRYWDMLSYLKSHGRKCNNVVNCDEGFQEYPDMKPFKLSIVHETQDLYEISTPKKKLLIPLVKQPRYDDVNQWNNMQMPSFAQMEYIAPGSKRKVVTKLLEFLYNGRVSESENVMENDVNTVL